MRRKRIILFIVLFFISFLSAFPIFGQVALDTLYVEYSNHGLGEGKSHFTLCKMRLSLSSDSNIKQNNKLLVQLTNNGTVALEKFFYKSSEKDLIRDFGDYNATSRLNKFRSAGEKQGLLQFSVNKNELRPSNTIYFCSSLPQSAKEGDLVSYSVLSASLNGTPLFISEKNQSNHKVFKICQTLFAPGDDNSKNYRIPAILTSKKGAIIALADKRKNNQADLPEDIDIVAKRSLDGGRTWSPSVTIARGQGRNRGYGDAAIVETQSGKLIIVFAGGVGLWAGRPQEPLRVYMSESTDDGVSWSVPKDITSQIYGSDCINETRKKWWSLFCTSGRGLVSSSGRVMFTMAVREGKAWSLNNYVLYSDNEGLTWNVSGPAFIGGDESKLLEIEENKILMSIRNKHKGTRIYNISLDNGETWRTPSQWSNLPDPACNGSILRYTHPTRPQLNFIIHSIPNSSKSRENGSIFISFDEGKTWKCYYSIYPGKTAYTDLCILPSGDIGYFAEEDDPISLVFVSLSPEHLLSKGKNIEEEKK